MAMTLGYQENKGGWTLEYRHNESSSSGGMGGVVALGITYTVAGILLAQPHPAGKAVGVGILAIPDPIIFAAGYAIGS